MPTRKHWRAEFSNGPALVYTKACHAFGWKAVRHFMPAGAVLRVRSSGAVPRHLAPNLTLYVRGRATVTSSAGEILDDRVPGMFSADRPDHPTGIFTVQAVEEMEFWCFNYTANRRALPDLTPLRFPGGGVFLGQEGDRVLVCAGSLGPHEAGDSFRFGGNELVAAPETYGLVIGGDREA